MNITTKRGHKFLNVRPNKQALGYMKMIKDNRISTTNRRDLNRLCVYGSLDVLWNKMMYTESVVKHCPCDSSYTKRVKVIGKAGKRRLKALRAKK